MAASYWFPSVITTYGASATVKKNYRSFSGAYALSLIGLCNADTFSGAAPGQLIIADVDPTTKHNGEFAFYEVAITIKYNKYGWDYVEKLDIGSHVLNDDGKQVLPVDDSGQATTQPVLLDGSGKQLENPTPSNAVYVPFRVADYVNYRSLGLL